MQFDFWIFFYVSETLEVTREDKGTGASGVRSTEVPGVSQ